MRGTLSFIYFQFIEHIKYKSIKSAFKCACGKIVNKLVNNKLHWHLAVARLLQVGLIPGLYPSVPVVRLSYYVYSFS